MGEPIDLINNLGVECAWQPEPNSTPETMWMHVQGIKHQAVIDIDSIPIDQGLRVLTQLSACSWRYFDAIFSFFVLWEEASVFVEIGSPWGTPFSAILFPNTGKSFINAQDDPNFSDYWDGTVGLFY